MRWSLIGWLDKYRLGVLEAGLQREGYDGHPGYLCSAGEQEVEDLVEKLQMKRPQAKVFRQAVIDLNRPRPVSRSFASPFLLCPSLSLSLSLPALAVTTALTPAA